MASRRPEVKGDGSHGSVGLQGGLATLGGACTPAEAQVCPRCLGPGRGACPISLEVAPPALSLCWLTFHNRLSQFEQIKSLPVAPRK